MKIIKKHISPLFVSGLIIAVYTVVFSFAASCPTKLSAQTNCSTGHTLGHTVVADIAKNIFPQLKSLISL